MAHQLVNFGQGEGTERLCTFSDGVFAIAITLLVLNLQVPQAATTRTEDLQAAVWALRPQFIAFAVSFGVIGLLWTAHHRMFAHIMRYDARLLWLNLLVLLFVAFLPFPTSLLAEHPTTAFAISFYALAQTGAILAQLLLWVYATWGHRLVDPAIDPLLVRYIVLRCVAAAAVFVLSVPLAHVNPGLAQWSWILVPTSYAVLRYYFRRQIDDDDETGPTESLADSLD